MIEIKLTGDDAIKYLAESNPDIKQMEETIKTAQAYIEVLENQLAVLDEPKEPGPVFTSVDMEEATATSFQVLRDSEIAKEDLEEIRKHNAKHLIEKSFSEAAKDTGVYITGKWTDREIGVIEYAMSRPSNELNRRFTVLVEKLGRTESSVRSKLETMGLHVSKGIIYKD
jgi:hypothetical protein